MRFLFDANAVIEFLDLHPKLTRKVRQYSPLEFGIPSIAMHELYFGTFKSQRREENLQQLTSLHFEVLPFDQDDALYSGEVRAILARAGTPIGPLDVMIAGQALSRDLTVITHNVREFSRVPGLRVEDWQ
jgi:tRNA(fMet)-specific endonuclease VapC